MVIEAGFGPDEKEDEIRPWINIENEHGDEVLMRWPPEKKARSTFWLSVGLSIVLVAVLGLGAIFLAFLGGG